MLRRRWRIRPNWELKLTALLLALLLWVIVAADRPTTAWITVPVQVVLPGGGPVSGSWADPGQVAIRFSGDGDEMWELAVKRSRLALRLPLRETAAGAAVHSYSLEASMVQVPSGLGVLASEIRPMEVRVRYDGR